MGGAGFDIGSWSRVPFRWPDRRLVVCDAVHAVPSVNKGRTQPPTPRALPGVFARCRGRFCRCAPLLPPSSGTGHPRRAASIAATSSFFIDIIASNARLAAAPSGSASAASSARGVICHDTTDSTTSAETKTKLTQRRRNAPESRSPRLGRRGQCWTICMTLPQVSSKVATVTGPALVGGLRNTTPSFCNLAWVAAISATVNEVNGMPASNNAFW